MLHENSSLLELTEIEECQSAILDNLALEDAFRRIESDSRFSSEIPEITNYDDYVYPDCGHDDNGNN